MHALGIHHEMIREDRNKSVWINYLDIYNYVCNTIRICI